MSFDVLIILFLQLLGSSTFAQFDLQHLGRYVPVEKRNDEDFCESKFRLSDAEYLFYAATQNSSIEPCDDFREFALGTFRKYRALNDRYEIIGFSVDVIKAHLERQRKVVAAKIDDNKDSRVDKVIKNYFQKCVSSSELKLFYQFAFQTFNNLQDYVRQNATKEILEYLVSLGGSPFVSGSSWNSSNFNFTKIFH